MFAVSGLGITLFLGGWSSPVSFLRGFRRGCVLRQAAGAPLRVHLVRGTVPRLRMDQLMNFAWKFMLPMTLVTILSAGICTFSRSP